jgi:hypothetical protein
LLWTLCGHQQKRNAPHHPWVYIERDCGLPRHSLYNRQQDSVWHKNKLIFQDLTPKARAKVIEKMETSKDKNQISKVTEGKNETSDIGYKIRKFIRIIAWLLGGSFTFLKLHGMPVPSLNTAGTSTIFLQLSLIIYYFSWWFGPSGDTRFQEKVLVVSPNKGKMPVEAIGMVVLLAILFAVLCLLDTHKKFGVFLLLFWLINYATWRYLVKKILGPNLDKSEEIYTKYEEYYLSVKLNVVRDYIDGSWQWVRFNVGVILLLAINIIYQFDLSTNILKNSQLFSVESLNSFLVLFFVLIVELWIWIYRIKTKIAFEFIDSVASNYMITPKKV